MMIPIARLKLKSLYTYCVPKTKRIKPSLYDVWLLSAGSIFIFCDFALSSF